MQVGDVFGRIHAVHFTCGMGTSRIKDIVVIEMVSAAGLKENSMKTIA